MATEPKRYTLVDLQDVVQPWDDTRYEIIDGELLVSSQPSLEHQYVSGTVAVDLSIWNKESGRGIVLPAPGLIFADDDNAAPDVVWLSWERLRAVREADGKLHGPPELVVEVLSPGNDNERRDRDVKLRLYSRRSVDGYWIFDCQQRRAEVYRRAAPDPAYCVSRPPFARTTRSNLPSCQDSASASATCSLLNRSK